MSRHPIHELVAKLQHDYASPKPHAMKWEWWIDGRRHRRTICVRISAEDRLLQIAYRAVGLEGRSSHSGRRTFITRAARLVHKAGGSLRDVQLLAGHRSIQTTQRYIDGDTDAQRKLVSMI